MSTENPESNSSTASAAAGAAAPARAPVRRSVRGDHRRDGAAQLTKVADYYGKLVAHRKENAKRAKAEEKLLKQIQEGIENAKKLALKERDTRMSRSLKLKSRELPCTFMQKKQVLTPAMRVFMGVDPADETVQLSQNEIITRFTEHVQRNGLQDPKKKSVITVDATLKPLLPEGQLVTSYTNFHANLWERHLAKKGKPAAVAAA